MSKFDKKLGAALKDQRIMHGLNQTDVGESIKVSFQQIAKFENGTNSMKVEQFVKVCDHLGIKPGKILEGL